MITGKEQLLSMLSSDRCHHTLYEHPPVFTADESMQYCADIPGAHVKNLFLRNKKKTVYFLLTVKEEKRVDLLTLGERLGLGRLSFASSDDLIAMLGIQPGSVTPLAIINDHSHHVMLYFDHDLMGEEFVSVHPMQNTATICIKLCDLIQFIDKSGQKKIDFIEVPFIGLG